MDWSPAPLFVDDRDGSRDLIRIHPMSEHGELARLDSGDICIIGNGPDDEPRLVGVEVKSIHDLLSSIDTGRLHGVDGQLARMFACYSTVWLLYYGQTRIGIGGRLEVACGNPKRPWRTVQIGGRDVPYGYLASFLVELEVVGVSVKHATDVGEAAQWLGSLHRWWSKPWSAHKGLRTFNRSREVSLQPGMDAAMLQRARVASQLPGLGFEKAVAAARAFASVEAMCRASVEEWMAVPGIGKVLAKAITEAVR